MRIARFGIRLALLLTAVVSIDIIAIAAQPRARAGIPPEAWAEADLSVRRLGPDTFGALPASIRKDLIQRGCTIPQAVEYQRPHNVISGRFTSAAGTDWAVLCSRARVSAILVFRHGRTPPIELASFPDANYLQGLGDSTIGFSRVISVASARFIRAASEAGHGGPVPPRLDHEGIDDAFAGKGSTVLYFHSGKWLTLAGSD